MFRQKSVQHQYLCRGWDPSNQLMTNYLQEMIITTIKDSNNVQEVEEFFSVSRDDYDYVLDAIDDDKLPRKLVYAAELKLLTATLPNRLHQAYLAPMGATLLGAVGLIGLPYRFRQLHVQFNVDLLSIVGVRLGVPDMLMEYKDPDGDCIPLWATEVSPTMMKTFCHTWQHPINVTITTWLCCPDGGFDIDEEDPDFFATTDLFPERDGLEDIDQVKCSHEVDSTAFDQIHSWSPLSSLTNWDLLADEIIGSTKQMGYKCYAEWHKWILKHKVEADEVTTGGSGTSKRARVA
ncbi:hypothetical protein EDB19DRAFT_1911903 [Suillus lakei]|nr:hypothetical protein EDB19DRAFT_1911903 [Suillus lakei]